MYFIEKSIYSYFKKKLLKELEYHYSTFRTAQKEEEQRQSFSFYESETIMPDNSSEEGIINEIHIDMQFRPDSLLFMEDPEKSNVIMQGIKDEDPEVFNYLYENELPKTVKLIITNSGSIENAREIFHKAIVVLLENIYDNSLNINYPVELYLYEVSRLLWSEVLKKKNRHVIFDDVPYEINIDLSSNKEDEIPEEYEVSSKAIEKLDSKSRQLLKCFFFKKMSPADIAESFDYPDTVSLRVHIEDCIEKIKSEPGHL